MQCKSNSSSGSEDDLYIRKKAASIARAKQTASASDDDAPLIKINRLVVGCKLSAKNSHDAKELLKQKFQNAHSGGHIRCINSRCVYTLAIVLHYVLSYADAGKITFTSPASIVAQPVLRDLRNLRVVGM